MHRQTAVRVPGTGMPTSCIRIVLLAVFLLVTHFCLDDVANDSGYLTEFNSIGESLYVLDRGKFDHQSLSIV